MAETVQDHSLLDKYVIISADCHAGPPDDQLRPYFESKHQAAFDELVAGRKRTFFTDTEAEANSEGAGIGIDSELIERFRTLATAQWDNKFRIEHLEQDGIVAEVIFPNPGDSDTCPPFQTGHGFELQLAGARAYNRWLADFCSEFPERQAGIAMLPPFHEIEPVVEEIHRARADGLRGGVLLPLIRHSLPGYNDRRYDPIWSACAELGMPLNAHALNGEADNPIVYGDGPDAFTYLMIESFFFSRRALWFFIFGGVFDRHPDLKLVFTEQSAEWVPVELRRLDGLYHSPFTAQVSGTLELSPSEYWARNCWVGATFMSPSEAGMRHDIGIDNIMWGSDFPHPEGTFPYTRESLRKIYGEVPSAEVAPMLGENAARVYGFDLDVLRPLAAEIGPAVSAVAVPLPDDEVPRDHLGLGFK